ncbi:MAG TPA: LEA type 2 family protein [Thermoanaerobaculia bacterium]|nr:LEA type 2 family protein [Thermoanaerobaculia bacterium]
MNRSRLTPLAAAATLLLLGSTGGSTGCRSLVDLVIENPTYRIRDVRPRVDLAIPLSASTIEIDLGLEIDNPNSVGLRLDQLDFDLLVNGVRLINGVSNQDVRIPPEGLGRVELKTRMSYDDLRTLFGEVAAMIEGARPEYELRGTAYYQTPVGRLHFPLTVYRSGG